MLELEEVAVLLFGFASKGVLLGSSVMDITFSGPVLVAMRFFSSLRTITLSVLDCGFFAAKNFLLFSGTTTILSAPGAGMVMNSVAKGFPLGVSTSFLIVAVSIFKGGLFFWIAVCMGTTVELLTAVFASTFTGSLCEGVDFTMLYSGGIGEFAGGVMAFAQ